MQAALAQTAGANGSLEPLVAKMLSQLESLSLHFTRDTVTSLSGLSAACNGGMAGAGVNPPVSQQVWVCFTGFRNQGLRPAVVGFVVGLWCMHSSLVGFLTNSTCTQRDGLLRKT